MQLVVILKAGGSYGKAAGDIGGLNFSDFILNIFLVLCWRVIYIP